MTDNYLVFVGDMYYPDGGWRDFLGSYETLDEAVASAKEAAAATYNVNSGSWWHVVHAGEICVGGGQRLFSVGKNAEQDWEAVVEAGEMYYPPKVAAMREP